MLVSYNIPKKAFLFVLVALSLNMISVAQKPRFKEKKIAHRVKKHVKYLADDELEGRLTGSAGETKSAEYIARQFEKIGLTPMGENKYFQNMTVPNMRMAQGNSSFMVNDTVLTLFTDYYPISVSANNGRYKGDAINIGYGIEDQGLKTNDYKDKDVKGKAVVINLDLPGGMHPHSRFMSWAGTEFRVNYAKSKGARVVIFYSTDEDLFPSGTLAKVMTNSNLPVIFVKKDLSKKDTFSIDLIVDILLLSTESYNVLGYIDNGAKPIVVIGAHHDHLGRGEKGGSLAETEGDIHNGADDNASGVAALFELARIVKKSKHFKNNNYLFVAFTGEEQGLLGSKHFVKKVMKTDLGDRISYMINMDMIGHLDSTQKTLIINGVGTSPEWNKAIKRVSYPKRKIAKIKTTESGIGASDHTSFYLHGVPAVHFFTGQHQYYHKPTDDVEIVNYGGEAFVISYISRFMCEMDKQSGKLDSAQKNGEVYRLNPNGTILFTKTKDENQGRMNFKVTLGIMPDYVYDGEGMRVDGVKTNKPADKAGMLKGDIIIAMNGKLVLNIQDYMKVLSQLDKGDKAIVNVKRGNETKELNVQF
ncbi:MAG: hypothetical protein COA58_04710 [Bacteroidetes bacterium]|nr:MAG: hypothetical protein COA58_04710 [Bacteroidota bacterium]